MQTGNFPAKIYSGCANVAYSCVLNSASPPTFWSKMNKLRKLTVIGCVAALATFGVAACGGGSDDSSSSSASGGGGGDINVTMSSFPDYVDPQLSYTVEGWETLYNVYTP